jgi:hypothetical protein
MESPGPSRRHAPIAPTFHGQAQESVRNRTSAVWQVVTAEQICNLGLSADNLGNSDGPCATGQIFDSDSSKNKLKEEFFKCVELVHLSRRWSMCGVFVTNELYLMLYRDCRFHR